MDDSTGRNRGIAQAHTPWTAEQVASLERWQRANWVHPFTCPNRSDHPWNEEYGDYGPLIPTKDGWVCEHCDYTQDWAHEFTLTFDGHDDPLGIGPTDNALGATS